MDGILVCRVSSARQEAEGYSLEGQEELGLEYAREKGIRLLGEPFVFQETASKQAERKKFRRVLDFIDDFKGAPPLAVLAYNYSRLARNSHDQATIDEYIDEGRIVLHLFRENRVITRQSSPGDRLATDVDAAVAKHKARETGRTAREGMVKKAENGWFPHRAPPGYRNVEVELSGFPPGNGPLSSRRSRERIVEPDPTSAPFVLRMFELRAEGYSLDYIRRSVLAAGYAAGRRLHKSQVHKILHNPFYGGRFVTGGREYQGKHELFVPPEVFQRVRDSFEAGARPALKREKGGVFTGLIHCQECGCLVLHEHKVKRSGRAYDYWRCSNGRRAHPHHVYVREEELFGQFERALAGLAITEKLAEAIADEMKRTHDQIARDRIRAVERFKAQLGEVDAKQDRLMDLYLQGKADEEVYGATLKRLRDERERIGDQLARSQGEMDGAYLDLAKRTIELARDLKTLWNAATPREKRELIEKLVSNPVLEGRTLRYEIRKPFRLLAEMASGNVWLPRTDSNCRHGG